MTSKVGSIVQEIMRRDNLSYEQLEEKTGVPRSTLNNLVNKPESVPQLNTLVALGKTLHVPLYEMVEMAGFDLQLPPDQRNDTMVALYSLNRLSEEQQLAVWLSLPEGLQASLRAMLLTVVAKGMQLPRG